MDDHFQYNMLTTVFICSFYMHEEKNPYRLKLHMIFVVCCTSECTQTIKFDSNQQYFFADLFNFDCITFE